MAAQPPLLALPFEVRLKIFKHLLSPDSDHVYPLYHDRLGRDAFASSLSYQELIKIRRREAQKKLDDLIPEKVSYIHPQVLRVNHQIHAEASPLLYHRNQYLLYFATSVTKQCTGGNYPDHVPDPPSLFRLDEDNGTKRASHKEVSSSSKSPRLGIIYPHVFQRLRQINIVISTGAVWGSAMGGQFFSHTGRNIWKVLHVIAIAQGETPREIRLRITVYGDWWHKSNDDDKARQEMDKKLRPIFGMMKALQRTAAIAIEVENNGELQALAQYIDMRESEIDHWEKALSADMEWITKTQNMSGRSGNVFSI